MRIAWIAVVIACGGSSSAPVAPAPPPAPVVEPKPPSDPIEQALGEMEGLRDKMCACTDKACTDRVETDRRAWRDAMRERFRDSKVEPSEAQEKRGDTSEKAYRDCRRKLRGPGASIADAMVKMVEFKDKMCVCKDKPCADKVVDEMSKWSQEMAANADPDTKASDDDIKKMQEVTEQFTNCATKAMTPP
jgi:hypothetical protein